VLALSESCEVVLANVPGQVPLSGELAMPPASNLIGGGVVVLVGVAEFFGMVRSRLGGAQRLRDRQHPITSVLESMFIGPMACAQ
jgi:hypothetical protein